MSYLNTQQVDELVSILDEVKREDPDRIDQELYEDVAGLQTDLGMSPPGCLVSVGENFE